MAYKAPKPTKAQLAEAKVRAAASGIAMNQSAKGLRNASKAIVAGASMLPAGRAVKVATTAAKAATKAGSAARANARGLKAANKPTNKTGTAADRADRATFQGEKNLIKNADPARANRTRGGSVRSMKEYGGLGLTNAKLTPKQAQWQKTISKELNPVRKAKPKTK